VPRTSGLIFMFCAPRLFFGGTEGVDVNIYILRPWTRFRRYRGRRVPFSCFALTESFWALPSASNPIFIFSAPGLIFGGTKGIRSHFHVLCSRTCLGRFRWRRTHFHVCSPEPILGGTEGVGSRFHVLRSRTHFRRYRGCRVPLSCLALPNSFSAVPRATSHVFMFCAFVPVLGSTEGIRSHFHVLRS
jgi:hypothetical protein